MKTDADIQIAVCRAWSDGCGCTEYRVYAVRHAVRLLIGYVNNWGGSGSWQVEAAWVQRLRSSRWTPLDTRREAVGVLVAAWNTAGQPLAIPERADRYTASCR